jgi:hypothetical protein
MSHKPNDCEIILHDIEDLFLGVGNCIDTLVDEKRGKSEVLGTLFDLGKKVTRLGWDAGVCAVRNTPKAVVTVAKVKREVKEALTEEYYRLQQEIKKEELEESIRQLKHKSIDTSAAKH